MTTPAITRRPQLGIAAVALTSALASAARADNRYPSRLVRLIPSYGAGDIALRSLVGNQQGTTR
jgi:hypothetical protein